VSDLDFFSGLVTPPAESGQPIPKHAPDRRHRALLISGVVAAVAVLCAGYVLLRDEPRDDRPVVMPDTLVAQPEAEVQFAEYGWRTSMEEQWGDHPFDGRAFGSFQARVLMNLVVIRGDSRDEGDVGLGRPPYTQFGEVTCTHTFQFDAESSPDGEDSEPYHSDRMLLCWRARDTLTVSVLLPLGGEGFETAAAQAVDGVWALNQ
jgi:hypothetical protein